MSLMRRLFGLILVLLLLVIAAKNNQLVLFHLFFGYAFSWPLITCLIIFFAVGVMVGFLLIADRFWAMHKELKILNKMLLDQPSKVFTDDNQSDSIG